MALLAARTVQRLGREAARRAWTYLVTVAAGLVALGFTGIVHGPALVTSTYWMAQAPDLAALAQPAGVIVAVGGSLMAIAALRRRVRALVAILVCTALPMIAIVITALTWVGPLFSWRPVAEALVAQAPADTEVVFEAPTEYQLVAGLVFYLRRPVTVLEPRDGLGALPYLVSAESPFITRAELARRWQGPRPMTLVSDPTVRRETPADIAPHPFHVLARFGDRWVLANFPPGAAR